MGKNIKDTDIEKAKQKSLLDYIQNYATPKSSSGNTVSFLSPLRSESNPSFVVYKDTNTWHDFGTGEGGDIISFVMEYDGLGFLDAVRHLNGTEVPITQVKTVSTETIKRLKLDKTAAIQKLYSALSKGNAFSCISKYFKEKGVEYYSEIGGIIYSYGDKKYVALPIPYPEKVVGLECRELSGTDRKTFGQKILWLLKRDTKRFLVTESILDALAGDKLIRSNISLCALNGVGNVKWLKNLAEKYQPEEILLALDNDTAGEKAEEEAIALLKEYSPETKILKVTAHKKAGVKDLHKLLIR